MLFKKYKTQMIKISFFQLLKIDSSLIYIFNNNLGEFLSDLETLEIANKDDLIEAANSNELEKC